MLKNMVPLAHNQALATNISPQLRYLPAEDFPEWQMRARRQLETLLGLPLLLPKDQDFVIEFTNEEANFTEIRFTFQSEDNYYLPCHLLVPRGVTKPLPVVICLQGHATGMHRSLGRAKYENDPLPVDGDRDFCIRAVKEGYCALAIEQRNFGECGSILGAPDCYTSSMVALTQGRTTIGERVWDVQRSIDVLEQHFPQVDTKNIVCMGNSGGGTTAFYASCLDRRIKYSMPSCAVCTYDDSIGAMYHCACNYIPSIRKYFDMGDLAGLIAPRPLVIVAGKNDDIFPIAGVRSCFEKAQILYLHGNAPDKVVLIEGNEGHRFYAQEAWEVMNRMMESSVLPT